MLAVGADGVLWTFFSLIYHFSFLSPSLWETARYRLKYCLKGPLSPKQPTNLTYQICYFELLVSPAKFSRAGKFTLKYQSFETDFDFEVSKVDYIPLIPGVFSNALRC